MKPSRLFRPLKTNEKLFVNPSSNGYLLLDQPSPGAFAVEVCGSSQSLVQGPVTGAGAVGQKAANSDFGMLRPTFVAAAQG